MQELKGGPRVRGQCHMSEQIAPRTSDEEAVSHGRAPLLTGCPWHDVNEMLQSVGLRPTRQRMALGWLLFGKGERHLTAEMLYEEATLAKVPVSLATVYNTLNQLTEAGLEGALVARAKHQAEHELRKIDERGRHRRKLDAADR